MSERKAEKKHENSIKKLEKELHDFQKHWEKQWETFLTNHFSHLISSVGSLSSDVAVLVKQNVKEHDRIQKAQEIMQDNMEQMNKQQKTELEVCQRIVGILDKKI